MNKKKEMEKKPPTASKIKKSTGNKPKRSSQKNSDTKRSVDTTSNGKNETRNASGNFPIVGIGASAGGLQAIEEFFSNMPSDSGFSFVIVTHLSPNSVSLLPELLQKKTTIPVAQVKEGDIVKPDNIYVIPPGFTLTIVEGIMRLIRHEVKDGLLLPIDVFFRSLAEDQGIDAIGIVLSGTGSDGSQGIGAIKAKFGLVMAQSEESAKYSAMPLNAIKTGHVDYILPVDEMPNQLVRYYENLKNDSKSQADYTAVKFSTQLQKIFGMLRGRTGHDFSLYKKNTIYRQIERRMDIQKIEKIDEYIRYLKESDRELDVLFKKMLIGVTHFFRDPEAFDELRKKVLPDMMVRLPEEQPFRVWIPGCSTGEEAYSIAILLHEILVKLDKHNPVQIFATDIDTSAIDFARRGVYTSSVLTDIDQNRLKRYFLKENGSYRIKKHIREMLVYAPQDINKDPPFTKIDLLCCRNLLIYLGNELQKKIIPLFHYSIRSEGILFLGSSESIGQFTDLFQPIDKKWKIFRRTESNSESIKEFSIPSSRLDTIMKIPEEVPTHVEQAEEVSVLRLVEALLAQSGTPPCAITDEDGNIIYIHGKTGLYLEPAEGKITTNIIQMARSGLKSELMKAFHEMGVERREIRCPDLRVKTNGGFCTVSVTLKPILDKPPLRGMLFVIFREVSGDSKQTYSKGQKHARPYPKSKRSKDFELLEQELRDSKENLQTTIEELEASNEEQKSTNEELQSINEELQSTNEELETSKEELQSLNEESSTVNAELQTRIDSLAQANDDMKNLLDSTSIATIFLDTDLNIRRFTSHAVKIIPLTATDVGRPISNLAFNLKNQNIVEQSRQVLKNLDKIESTIESDDGASYLTRIMPYRTVSNVIDGVVITFVEISELVNVTQELDHTQIVLSYAQSIVDTVREPLIIINQDFTVVSASKSFYQFFQVDKGGTVGKKLFKIGNKQWDKSDLKGLLKEVFSKNKSFDDYKVEHTFETIGRKKLLLNARQLISDQKKKPIMALISFELDKV